jgi:hypothetical protein
MNDAMTSIPLPTQADANSTRQTIRRLLARALATASPAERAELEHRQATQIKQYHDRKSAIQEIEARVHGLRRRAISNYPGI